MAHSSISVVLPAFNEERGFAAVLDRVHDTLEELRQRHDVELVVVDDGSTDGTAAILNDFSRRHPSALHICTHRTNKGLVEAMKTGARAATGATVVMLDADLSYAPEIVERLSDALEARGAAAVLASPYMPGGAVENVPLDRLLASRAANWLLSRCVGGRINTFTGMVRAYDAAVLRALLEREVTGEFNAWAVSELLRRGLTVEEIPAMLAWPRARTEAPSRISAAGLWRRTKLVLASVRVMLAAGQTTAIGPAC